MPTKILIDTMIWSLMLRRRPQSLNPNEQRVVQHVRALTLDDSAALVGPIRQEILTGVRSPQKYADLVDGLTGISLLPMDGGSFDLAARCANRCMDVGVAIDDIDLMICAASIEHDAPIWTLDPDFKRYEAAFKMPPLYVQG